MLTVAQLKYVLKQFGYPVGGKKSVLQSRVMVVLRLKGSGKMCPVIKQIPRVAHKFDFLVNFKKDGPTTKIQPRWNPEPNSDSIRCSVKFKEAAFYTNIDTLVEPTPLGMLLRHVVYVCLHELSFFSKNYW